MDSFLTLHLEALRAQLVCCRLEKESLHAEISSALIKPARKQEALVRYADILSELRKLVSELQKMQGKRRRD